MTSQARDIARNASVVGGVTMLSRLLGFARDVLTAYILGAGPLADAFFAAFRYPNLARALLAEGTLHVSLVPAFTRIEAAEGMKAAQALVRTVMLWALLAGGLLCLVMMLLARPFAGLVAPGFAQDPVMSGLTANLVMLSAPYFLFAAGTAVSAGALNSLRRFLSPALSPVALNLVMIAFLLFAPSQAGRTVLWLALGVSVGGLAQLLLQQPFLASAGFSWRGRVNPRDPAVGRVLREFLPCVFGSSHFQLCVVAVTALASFLPVGAVSGLYYAERLIQLPLGVFGTAVGVAALPNLSALAASGDREGFAATLDSALRLSLFISVPAAAGLCGTGATLVPFLLKRGAFDASAAQITSVILFAYSAGLPALAASRTLIAAHYARGNIRLPALAAAMAVGLCLGAGLVLMHHIGHVGLALAVTLAAWADVLILAAPLRRELSGWAGLGSVTARIAALGLGVWGASAWMCGGFGAVGLLGIPLVAAAYFLAAWAWKLPEAAILAAAVTGRAGRGTGAERA